MKDLNAWATARWQSYLCSPACWNIIQSESIFHRCCQRYGKSSRTPRSHLWGVPVSSTNGFVMKLPDSNNCCRLKITSFSRWTSNVFCLLWCSVASQTQGGSLYQRCRQDEAVVVVYKKCWDMTQSCRCLLVICVFSSLEDCLAAHGCSGVENLRLDLERTAAKLLCAQAGEVHLKAELTCVKER